MKAATMGENVGKVSREQRLHSRHPASPSHVGPGVLETPDGAEWRKRSRHFHFTPAVLGRGEERQDHGVSGAGENGGPAGDAVDL